MKYILGFIAGAIIFLLMIPIIWRTFWAIVAWLLHHQTVMVVVFIIIAGLYILMLAIPRQTDDPWKHIKAAGEAGERQVAYHLDWLTMKGYKVFNNLSLINDQGEKHGEKTSIINPSSQSYRHRFILESIIGTQYPINDLIVIANDNTIIVGQDNNPVPVVKHDGIIDYIMQFPVTQTLTKDEIDQIANLILNSRWEG